MRDKLNKYAEDLKEKIPSSGKRKKSALQLAYCEINKCVYVCVTGLWSGYYSQIHR